MYAYRQIVEAGGPLSYNGDLVGSHRLAGTYGRAAGAARPFVLLGRAGELAARGAAAARRRRRVQIGAVAFVDRALQAHLGGRSRYAARPARRPPIRRGRRHGRQVIEVARARGDQMNAQCRGRTAKAALNEGQLARDRKCQLVE